MKKFVTKLVIFAVIIIIADFGFGVSFAKLMTMAKGGNNARNSYIADRMTEDVLIFGSSRAIHHYDPRIIEDSIGLSCYNCGRDGNGIIFNYGQYLLFSERHTPRIIIYDLADGFDLLTGDDKHKYISGLKLYYDRSGISDIFDDVDKTERFKLFSILYRLNGKWLGILSDCTIPMQSDIQGFRPMTGVMPYEPKSFKETQSVKYDSLKMCYFQKLVNDCKFKDVKLIFAASPLYGATSSTVYNQFKEFARENRVPFLDYYSNNDISRNKKYFKDTSHLNEEGASEYTKRIIKELRVIINID